MDELALCREAHECAEAHRFDPEAAAWIDVVAGETTVEVALGSEGRTPEEIEVAGELLTPLAPAIRARIVDEVVSRQIEASTSSRPATPPAPLQGSDGGSARPRARRWLLFATPLAAAAAAVLVFMSRESGERLSSSLDGEVRVAPATRGSDPGDGTKLEVRASAWFYLDCGAPGPARDMLGAVAEPAGGGRQELLRARFTEASTGSWHVQADLSPGRWTISCHVFDRELRRTLRLRHAALEVTP